MTKENRRTKRKNIEMLKDTYQTNRESPRITGDGGFTTTYPG